MNFIQDVIDLEVYDENGKLITEIKTMQKGTLEYKTSLEDTYLRVKDALFNLSLLEQLGEKESNESLSEFEKSIAEDNEITINFNNKGSYVPVKLIGRGIIYDVNTGKISHDFKLIVPKANLIKQYRMDLGCSQHFAPLYEFKLEPFNDKEDLFQLKFKERE